MNKKLLNTIAGAYLGLSVLSCQNPTNSEKPSENPIQDEPTPVEITLVNGENLESILNDGYVDIRNNTLEGVQVTGDYDSITWSQGDESGNATYDSETNKITLDGNPLYGFLSLQAGETTIDGLTKGPAESVFYASSDRFNEEFGSMYTLQPGTASEPTHYTLENLSNMFGEELSHIYDKLVDSNTQMFSYGLNPLKEDYFVKIQDKNDNVTVYSLTPEQFESIESNNPYNLLDLE